MTDKIICVLGRTGSGKDTVVNLICEKYNLKQLVSYTTRPKRINEGNTHVFIRDEEFLSYKEDIAAYTEINGYKYFSTNQQINECDVYILDPNGIKFLRESRPDVKFISIYIDLPYEVRKDRAIGNRHDNLEIFESRNKDESKQFDDFEKNKEYDHKILNLDLEKSIKHFEAILNVEGFINESKN